MEQINEMAETLRRLDQDGQLVKFKAVMAATGCLDLEIACRLAEHLDDTCWMRRFPPAATLRWRN